jgi:hypothetical protein
LTLYITQAHAKTAGKRVILFCLFVELTIQALDLLFNYFQLIDSSSLRKIFNVAREQSLGTWFSVVQAAVAGLVLLGLHYLSRIQNAKAWGWLLLAVFFLYISADDAAKIHERVGGYIGKISSTDSQTFLSGISSTFPSYNWQWVFAPFFGLMGLYILIFLWRQLTETHLRLMILAALGCWAVAVGIDFIEGTEGVFESIAKSLDVKKYTVSHPLLMLEEFLEMLGTTLFLSLFVQKLLTNLAAYCKAS